MDNGLIHIYCGDGKGKTTAAVGLGVRAAGQGCHVLFTQFLKKNNSGELSSFEKLAGNFTVLKGAPVSKFVFAMTNEEKTALRKEHQERLDALHTLIQANKFDVLIMDEIIATVNLNILDESALIDFLKNKPKGLEIVMTGRDPSAQLIQLADYVSEVCARKHPYEKGVGKRRGIEY